MKSNTPPREMSLENVEMFTSAEEAWFWYIRCEKSRADDMRARSFGRDAGRPCEPSDIFRWVEQLLQRDALSPLHLVVLGEYGYLDRYPDPGFEDEEVDFLIWFDAFCRIGPMFSRKGILA